MAQIVFSKLIPQLHKRGYQATLGELNPGNVGLRNYLSGMFAGEPGHAGSLTGEPVFEAMFGWQESNCTLEDLRGKLLNADLLEALANPPEDLKHDYAFPLDRHPYSHQLEAWQILCGKDFSSLVVASGTGSGKTECFMIPILHRLAEELRQTTQPLVGVRALFLYPLNALINSQRDRLSAWTNHFHGDIRFCLYNGNTPEAVRTREQRHMLQEVIDRTTLRESPPPILVTNATMLEYMLVRNEDSPILKKSIGKLEWIVLDEAHTYMGSQAAELALLLRRVQLAFKVAPDRIRFVATSATIGDSQKEEEVRRFLAEVAGTNLDNVHVVKGIRHIPLLPSIAQKSPLVSNLDMLESIGYGEKCSSERYDALCQSAIACDIRKLFSSNKGVAQLSEIKKIAQTDNTGALRWLDLLSDTKNSDEMPFLPLRGHLFHRQLSGLWACADPDCPHKAESLKKGSWPYGAVWTNPRVHCTCGSPVYEIVTCRGCRTPYLVGARKFGTVRDTSGNRLPCEMIDLGKCDRHYENFDIDFDASDEENIAFTGDAQRLLILPLTEVNDNETLYINRETRFVADPQALPTGALLLAVKSPDFMTGRLNCPACGASDKSLPFYKSNYVGTRFLQGAMVPVLLEFAPDGDNPANHPCCGRKLLTFNDSRQGTARNAMRLQQFSELQYIRALVYHFCLPSQQPSNHAELQQQLEILEKLPTAEQLLFSAQIDTLRQQLANVGQSKSISFDQMCERLMDAGTSFNAIFAWYKEKAPSLFNSDNGMSYLAGLLLFREFGRRPKSPKNLETMGLVAIHYPKLDAIRDIPTFSKLEFEKYGFGIQDWRNFLKICIDFIFRANGAVNFPQNAKRWLGMPYTQTRYRAPRSIHENRPPQKNVKFWPQAHYTNQQSRPVLLLERALHCSAEDWEGADIINSVLREAWESLTLCGVLDRNDDGYALNYKQMAFVSISRAWLCPMTGSFLDTTFAGLTPYVSADKKQDAKCTEWTIPVYEHPFGKGDSLEDKLVNARLWLKNNPDSQKLHAAGLWRHQHDLVIELSPLFMAAEHSAQLASYELEKHTKKFKDGDINVLSCSTTMEMGIDIGGISLVGMNNVPPHPANYLQRTGRAGRRRETRSLAITMCGNSSHEQHVYHNTRWAFDTPLPTPYVSLSSRAIMQRHVNALLLTNYLQINFASDNISKLTSGNFFLASTNSKSHAEHFENHFEAIATDDAILSNINILCRNAQFVLSPQELVYASVVAMNKARTKWIAEYSALEKILETIQQDQTSAAVKALNYRKSRLADEYLLKELVTLDFLPAHGFPTQIATFETMTCEKLSASKFNPKRDDNLFFRRELPSRDLPRALSEYAPGNKVAIDGLVYESAGITLNWHIPATENKKNEIQNFRNVWLCPSCHYLGTAPVRLDNFCCTSCGMPLESNNWREYIEPAGFSVDFYSHPNNCIATGLNPVPPAEVRVVADGEWIELGAPQILRFRITTAGKVFHSSRGAHGKGYAVCLSCGRVESVCDTDEIPARLQDHKKLRGGSKKNDFLDTICPACLEGNGWQFKSPVWLACERTTDVMEIQIRQADGAWLNNIEQASPIAVALRDSIASHLGIESNELSWNIETRKIAGTKICSIFIFDNNASGYASSVAGEIQALLNDVHRRLNCPANCDSICPQCILDFDQRAVSLDIDRHKGLEIISDQWLLHLHLPEQYHIFGDTTAIETLPIVEAFLGALSPTSGVCLFVGDTSCFWQPENKYLHMLIDILCRRKTKIYVGIKEQFYNSCSEEEKLLLLRILARDGVSCVILPDAPFAQEIQNGKIAGFVFGEREITKIWAVLENDDGSIMMLSGSPDWELPNIHRQLALQDLATFQDAHMATSAAKDFKPSEFSCTLANFGLHFLVKLESLVKETTATSMKSHGAIISISYSDRYFSSPLVVVLLYRLLLQMKESLNMSTISLNFCLSNHIKEAFIQKSYWDNWSTITDRNEIICNLFNHIGNVHINNMPITAMHHFRRLHITFEDGCNLAFSLDQGFGFIRIANGDSRFPFEKSYEEQTENLRNVQIGLVANGDMLVSVKTTQA